MILDDLEVFERLDAQGMADEIANLPQQLNDAWRLGQDLPLPEAQGIERVVLAGMGGSAIGADLVAAYAAPTAKVPLQVWRNYDLPAYAGGPKTLLIASSHSGNTEETLSAFEAGIGSDARVMVVTTGGELARRAEEAGAPVWRFRHGGQPRAAVGFSSGLLLAALSRLGVLPDPAPELAEAVEMMAHQQKKLAPEVEVTQNPAKRMAGQLIDRWPTVVGADFLAPVARRWRTQIAELAKAVAQFEELPEADHNMVAGVEAPESLIGQTMVLFLKASGLHPRNLRRTEITREILMVEGFNTDEIEGLGDGRLAQQWTCLHYGDHVAFFLAMAYGIDPTPVRAIEGLKMRFEEDERDSA